MKRAMPKPALPLAAGRSGVKVAGRPGVFYLTATRAGIAECVFPGKDRPKIIRFEKPATGNLGKAKRLLERYFRGDKVSFKSLKFEFSGCTGFEKKILRALARLPYGKCISYKELAESAGSPQAARAVGQVMRKNRIPILIPCHRVVTAGGGIGGYSQGLKWKKYLLALEEKNTRSRGARLK